MTPFQRMAMQQALQIPAVRQVVQWAAAHVEGRPHTNLRACPPEILTADAREALQLLREAGAIGWDRG